MTGEGKCEKCGFVEEDTSLHLFQLHSDRFRLRGMIAYAKNAPDFSSCKSILADALDGVNGAENYEEVKGEREALRARIEVLEKAAEYAEHHPNCGYTFDHVTQTGEMVGCTCGLSAALDALKEGSK